MKEVNTFINDDYAGLDAGDLEFYYGYEVTYCPEHGYGPDEVCDEVCNDCDDVDWCFTVHKKGKEVFKVHASKMPVEEDSEPVGYLLAGIGMYLAKSERKKKRKKMSKKKKTNKEQEDLLAELRAAQYMWERNPCSSTSNAVCRASRKLRGE